MEQLFSYLGQATSKADWPLLFVLYGLLGWLLQCAAMAAGHRRWMLAHGVLVLLPVGMLSGGGALVCHLLARVMPGSWLLLFLAGALLGTLVQYISAKLLVAACGSHWWNYGKRRFNYKGMLCLEGFLSWGVGAILLGCTHGFIEKLVGLVPGFVAAVVWWGGIAVFGIGLAVCVVLIVLRGRKNTQDEMQSVVSTEKTYMYKK